MSNLYNLKSCPFCGADARFRTVSKGVTNIGFEVNFEIGCCNKNCYVTTAKTYKVCMNLDENGKINVYLDERMKAVENWNKRLG